MISGVDYATGVKYQPLIDGNAIGVKYQPLMDDNETGVNYQPLMDLTPHDAMPRTSNLPYLHRALGMGLIECTVSVT
jgi:hypothetical protein